MRLFAGGAVGDFEFVGEHARRRTEQRFPLEAVLHAYRCGHKVYSHWLREATSATLAPSVDPQQVVADVADFAIEYTDTIGTILANEYVARLR